MTEGHYHEEMVSDELLQRLEGAAASHEVSINRLSKDKGKTRVAISSSRVDLSAFWESVRASK